MKRYRVTHRTEYEYVEDVTLCHSEARLAPRTTDFQRTSDVDLICIPAPTHVAERVDCYGNRVTYFSLEREHRRLEVTAHSHLEVQGPVVAAAAAAGRPWEECREYLQSETDWETIAAREFVLDSPMAAQNDDVRRFATPSFPPGRDLLDACRDLNARIFNEFQYEQGFSTISTPLAEVLEHRRGVCQDFAHLFIASLRSLGLAARYVSGYLETLPPPGQEKLVGADASHAWLAVYVPGIGWVDFDPTNNLIPGDQHITLAVGRDYGDVTPLKGVIFGGGEHTVKVSVDVARLSDEDAANADPSIPIGPGAPREG